MKEEKKVIEMKKEKSEDYKELYLEQKISAIQIELQALQMRAQILGPELERTQRELSKYLKDKKDKKDGLSDESR